MQKLEFELASQKNTIVEFLRLTNTLKCPNQHLS